MNARRNTRTLLGRSGVRRSAYRLLAMVCAITLALGLTGASWAQRSPPAALQDTSPSLRAFPDRDRVDGWNWLAGEVVALTIVDADGASHVFDPLPADDVGYVDFYPAYDLVQGDEVTMTGAGGLVVVHTVKQLYVTSFNTEARIVGGIVDDSGDVHVWTGENNLSVTPSGGNWFADFSGYVDSLQFAGACGGAEAWGEGGSTIVDWCVPPPPPEPALPQGAHDGAEGVVHAAGCSAFGWAVDPDNPDRDLQVEILADGNPVTTVTADLLREDLTECPGGTCGFGINLWGLIPPGVEHQITAQAYDEETRAWVALWGTPKPLTCWGYPEGFHDGAVGTVNAAGCSAFGWAVDPDNRDRDLQVEILADGSPVTTVTADLLREDLTECPGGTCGWSADLRTLITLDQEHQITAQAYDVESNAWLELEATPKSLTCQSPPSTYLTAFPENDAVEGWEWPDGAPVYLSIDDPGTAASPDLYREGSMAVTPWGDARTYVRFDFAEEYDLKVGDIITLTDGVTPQMHVVLNLSVTEVDAAADTIAGTADEDAVVQVWPHGFDQTATVQATASDDGTWTAHFGDLFDLVVGTSGRSQIRDEAENATAVDWSVPDPWFTVFPEGEVVEARDWPLDAVVYMTIDDPATELNPDFAQDGTVILAPWGSGQRWLSIDFNGAYDVKPGDIVTLTDEVTPRMHTVRSLAVTTVNPATNTIAGTAGTGEAVNVWPHETGQQLTATPDATGAWRVDFTGVFDLVIGTAGRSEIRDQAGNATAVDWHVPNPHFTVFPEWDTLELWEWPIGAEVVLSIEDPETPASPDFENGYVIPPAEWNPAESFLWIDIAGLYDVKAGDIVTLTGAGFTVPHAVRPLAVTVVDAVPNTVSGTSVPGEVVHVWPHDLGSWHAGLPVTTGEDGRWIADLDDLPYDLMPWASGRAEIVDEIGNTTGIDWQAPLLVRIDIQPMTGLNLIPCGYPAAWLPVAVLSGEGFDATRLYTDHIRFGRRGTEAEVLRIGRDDRPAEYAADVNHDGLTDMVYIFRLGDTGFSCVDIPPGQRYTSVQGTLTGWVDEGPVYGVDVLRLFRIFSR